MSRTCLVRTGRASHPRIAHQRLKEDYLCDFILVARRTLDDLERRVFTAHFLLGADWRLCCGQLKLDRGDFFHCVYRIERKLGRVFRELQPYALFPIDEYFTSHLPAVKPLAMAAGAAA